MFTQFDEYSDQLMAVYVSSHEVLKREESNLTANSPWHAPHALMSEYVTVLQLHRLEPPTIGPVYEYPGNRGKRVNAAKTADFKESSEQELYTQYSQPPLQVDIRNAATVHAFWSRVLNV